MLLDFQSRHKDEYAQCILCKDLRFHSAVLGVVLDMPVVVRVEVVQKTVEFPRLQVSGSVQFLDKVAVVPFLCNDVLGVTEQKTVQDPQLQLFGQGCSHARCCPRQCCGRCPCCAGRRWLICPLVCNFLALSAETAEFPQLHFIDEVGCTCPSFCSDWCLMLRRCRFFGSPGWLTPVSHRGLGAGTP